MKVKAKLFCIIQIELYLFLFYSCCQTPKREDACCVTSGDIKEKGDWSKSQCEKGNSTGSMLSLLKIVVINKLQNNKINLQVYRKLIS